MTPATDIRHSPPASHLFAAGRVISERWQIGRASENAKIQSHVLSDSLSHVLSVKNLRWSSSFHRLYFNLPQTISKTCKKVLGAPANNEEKKETVSHKEPLTSHRPAAPRQRPVGRPAYERPGHLSRRLGGQMSNEPLVGGRLWVVGLKGMKKNMENVEKSTLSYGTVVPF